MEALTGLNIIVTATEGGSALLSNQKGARGVLCGRFQCVRRHINSTCVLLRCCCCRNIFPIWALGLYRRLVPLGHSRTSAAAADDSKAAAANGAVLAPGTAWLCSVCDFVSTAGSSSSSAANGTH